MYRKHLKRNKQNKMDYTRGITLVALVITIVILIILATVTVNVAFGDGGLIDQAKLAAEKTANSIYDEEASLANLTAYLNEQLGGGEILPPEDTEPPVITSFTQTEVTATSITVSTTASDNSNGTLKYEYRKGSEGFVEGGATYTFEGLTAETEYTLEVKVTDEAENSNTKSITVKTEPFEPMPTPEPEGGGTAMSNRTNGIIEIKWLEGNTNKVASEPNPPAIKTSGLPEGTTMEQVVFDEENQEWIAGTEYSYVAGTGSNDNNASKWANARVRQQINGENVDSYFVWIPRYAYRIIYFDSAESKKAYQEGTLTEEAAKANGKIIGYSDSRGIVDAEGRKIESVTSESNSPKTMVSEDYFMTHPAFMNGTSTGFENGEWNEELTGIWIGKYEAARSDTVGATQGRATTIKVQPGVSSWRYIQIGNMYTVSQNYAPDLKSHMLKNSEWGAVAYLTESKYGRNGTEVSINNNGATYYTGGGAEKAYATSSNVLQSSTRNVYGIYDLSGNAYEYVASYYEDGDFSSANSTFTNGTSDEYSTAYTGDDESSAYKYGDATYETSGWNGDYAFFVDSTGPFFLRGGSYYDGSNAGVFNFSLINRQLRRLRLISPLPSSVMCNLLSEQKINFF